MTTNSIDKHNYALDILRIFACFLVVLLHVCSYGIADISLSAPNTIFTINDYQIYNFGCCLGRSAVLIFVMISGSFLLDPNIEVMNNRLKKHIFKIIKLFLFFSLFGVICDIVFKSYFSNYVFYFFEHSNKIKR